MDPLSSVELMLRICHLLSNVQKYCLGYQNNRNIPYQRGKERTIYAAIESEIFRLENRLKQINSSNLNFRIDYIHATQRLFYISISFCTCIAVCVYAVDVNNFQITTKGRSNVVQPSAAQCST